MGRGGRGESRGPQRGPSTGHERAPAGGAAEAEAVDAGPRRGRTRARWERQGKAGTFICGRCVGEGAPAFSGAPSRRITHKEPKRRGGSRRQPKKEWSPSVVAGAEQGATATGARNGPRSGPRARRRCMFYLYLTLERAARPTRAPTATALP